MNKKDIFFVIIVIFSVISAMVGLGYIVTLVLGLSLNLLFPIPIQLLGLFIIAIGVGFLGWTLYYRKLGDITESTYVTIVKAIKRINFKKNLGRTEPLTVLGPYKYVRHPQYFGAFLSLVGMWLLLGYTFLFFGAVFLLLWFRFVLIPFEEKEIVAIFGDQYESYIRQVPSIIPFTNIFRNKSV
jgi:protein-S-isoprenylcysteine O-methyltransferase Ste14